MKEVYLKLLLFRRTPIQGLEIFKVSLKSKINRDFIFFFFLSFINRLGEKTDFFLFENSVNSMADQEETEVDRECDFGNGYVGVLWLFLASQRIESV